MLFQNLFRVNALIKPFGGVIFFVFPPWVWYIVRLSPSKVEPKTIRLVKVRAKTGWFRIRIMCLSDATCLPVDCCISTLALLKSRKVCLFSTKWRSLSSHWNVTYSCHDMADKLLICHLINNHSLSALANWIKIKKFRLSLWVHLYSVHINKQVQNLFIPYYSSNKTFHFFKCFFLICTIK